MTARRARAAPPAEAAAAITEAAITEAAITGLDSAWLLARLRGLLGPLRGLRLCVAYSGGLDSTTLLALLAAGRRAGGYRLRAIHVHHHLQSAADAWAVVAAAQARRLRVPFKLLHLAPPCAAGSVEALAREARYAALGRALAVGEALLTAHHLDDQLETLLLALLRGAGVAGLAAMPAVRPLGANPLVRPLLPVSRAELTRCAQRLQLEWVEDSSNANPRYDRNYLRTQVLPLLQARWPAAAATAARSAAHLAQAQGLLDELADAQLGAALDGRALRASVLRRLALPARYNLLRRWLRGLGARLPDQRRLQQLGGALLAARADAVAVVDWTGFQVRRHGDRLVLVERPAGAAATPGAPATAGAAALAPPAAPPGAPPGAPQAAAGAGGLQWHWRRRRWLALPGGGAIGWVPDAHGTLDLNALPPRLRVDFRHGGERLRAPHGTTTLKKLLQAHHIAPWQRAALPLLYDGGRMVAVADLWLDPRYAVARNAPLSSTRARLRWRACAD